MQQSSADNIELPYITAVYFDKEQERYVLNEKGLENILLQENVKNKPVVIISVAGAFRKGKSFLLNFFVRFLMWVQANGFAETPDWLGETDKPLFGFPWRGGSERETNGILLWAKPFLVKLFDGEEVVILLMDTQGAFDSTSSVKDCAIIFAISTMMSSMQIYNISGNLQEDYLAHLQLFTEYGRLALECSDNKPFQNLLFLIRDWPYPYEYKYGFSPEFLTKKLSITDNQHREIQSVREHIRDCFENVELFLLPHPGSKVATTPSFDGKLVDIDESFIQNLSVLITNIVCPNKLRPKKSQGSPIKCCDVITFFQSYLKIFQNDSLPEPKNMIMATAEANNLVASSNALHYYQESMESICGGNMPYMPDDELRVKHEKFVSEAISQFKKTKKFGDSDIANEYCHKLENDISELFDHYYKVNHSKQVNSFKFIITAFVVMIISIMISQILDLIGLDFMMTPFNVISIFLLALILFCAYAQFYGGYSGILYKLNMIPDIIIGEIKRFAIEKHLLKKEL